MHSHAGKTLDVVCGISLSASVALLTVHLFFWSFSYDNYIETSYRLECAA